MAGEHLELWDATGESLVEEFEPVSADPGLASDPVAYRFYNDKDGSGGAQTEEGWWLMVLAQPAEGGPLDSENNEFTEGRYLQARITSAGVGNPTDWIDLGPGSDLELPPIPAEEFVGLELRINPHADHADVAAWIKYLRWERRGHVGLDLGHFESVGNGIVSGVGDPQASFIVSLDGAAVEEDPDTDGPTEFVWVPDLRWVRAGIPWELPEGLVEIGTEDADSETPGAGESFIVVLTAGAGVVTVTKGVKAEAPEEPEHPVGEPLIARVTMDDSGVVTNDQIENLWVLGRFGAVAAGLSLAIHHGRAVVNNGFVRLARVSPLSLEANAENWVWVNRLGLFSVTQEPVPPPGRPMLLWVAVTDADSVIGQPRDARRIFGFDRYLAHQGAWDGGTAYQERDAASHDGLVYVALVATTGDEPSDAEKWQALWEFVVTKESWP